MKREDITNKKELALFILTDLSKRSGPMTFNDLFWEYGAGLGLDNFKNLLEEMCRKGWLNKTEEDTGSVPGYPHLRTQKVEYGISFDGIDHISELGLIESKFKKADNSTNNSGISLNGDNNSISVNQGSSLTDSPSQNPINPDKTKPSKETTSPIVRTIVKIIIGVVSGIILWLLTQYVLIPNLSA